MMGANKRTNSAQLDCDPWVDPQMAAILRAAVPIPPSDDVQELRIASVQSKSLWNDVIVPSGMKVTSSLIKLGDGERPVRCYAPANTKGTDILFLHGGGWSICSLDTHHAICVALAQTAGRRVFALHPRQAPEFPYPAPLDDVVAFLKQADHPLALVGDSAGANLALAAALRLRDVGLNDHVTALALMYGCYRYLTDTSSHLALGDGRFGLTSKRMQLFWSFYLGGLEASSAFADVSTQSLTGLPPIFVGAATLDPLFDDSAWLTDQLVDAVGVHTYKSYDGVVHGFLHYVKALQTAQTAIVDISRFLDEHART